MCLKYLSTQWFCQPPIYMHRCLGNKSNALLRRVQIKHGLQAYVFMRHSLEWRKAVFFWQYRFYHYVFKQRNFRSRKEKEQASVLACSLNVVVAQLFNVSSANDDKKNE